MEALRVLVTLGVMAVFFAILWWAYAPSRKADWARKGLLLDDDDTPETGTDHSFATPEKRGLSLISVKRRS